MSVTDFLSHNLFALMPVFPFVGWLINIFFGKRMKEPTPAIIASLMVLISFVIAVVGFVQVSSAKEAIVDTVRWAWLPGVGGEGKNLEFGFALDRLSSLMTLIITGVGFLIHVFAAGSVTLFATDVPLGHFLGGHIVVHRMASIAGGAGGAMHVVLGIVLGPPVGPRFNVVGAPDLVGYVPLGRQRKIIDQRIRIC